MLNGTALADPCESLTPGDELTLTVNMTGDQVSLIRLGAALWRVVVLNCYKNPLAESCNFSDLTAARSAARAHAQQRIQVRCGRSAFTWRVNRGAFTWAVTA